MIVVLRAGPLATVQDLGRPGLAHLGVGRSGAADRASLALANRLVANPESAAGLELTLGGFAARFDTPGTVALAGAPCPVQVGGRARAMHAPLAVDAGEVLEVGLPTAGVRTYLAVRGGIATPPVLGSCSTDLLAGLGPPVVQEGSRLPAGPPGEGFPVVDVAPVAPLPEVPVLGILPGPREDWFTAGALALLASRPYEVSPASDRVGVRLLGPRLERARAGELPSEGMVEGALQVPPDGAPVLFLADHPVTGGYPVVAVVEPDGVALAAQLRPGQRVRFHLVAAAG